MPCDVPIAQPLGEPHRGTGEEEEEQPDEGEGNSSSSGDQNVLSLEFEGLQYQVKGQDPECVPDFVSGTGETDVDCNGASLSGQAGLTTVRASLGEQAGLTGVGASLTEQTASLSGEPTTELPFMESGTNIHFL